MSKKNPILSNAEKYKQLAPPKTIRLDDKKPKPYTFDSAKRRLRTRLSTTMSNAAKLTQDMAPDGQIVASVTLHPSFLAKTFYPKDILKKYALKNVGSKEVYISPEVSVTDEQRAGNISSSLYFVSGKKESFLRLISDLENNRMDDKSKNDLTKIEDITLFDADEKLSLPSDINNDNLELCYEVVIHASESDYSIIEGLFKYINILQGSIFSDKTRSINGLTFCFVKIKTSNIKELAKFSFVRVVRPLPEIKLADRVISLEARREVVGAATQSKNINFVQSNIAIFDGGLFSESTDNAHIRYFDLTNHPTDDPRNLSHGSFVTSAIVYGEAEDYASETNIALPIDHYKVYSSVDNVDVGLVDVLDRIRNVLETTHYRFVNISLGPEYPCSDEHPSLWTSTLDKLAEDGHILILVAVGNSGAAGGEFARIQPPSDLLNGLSIGAADSKGEEWDKASYSNIGPGRRPGYVKPDALYFGGEMGDGTPKLQLIKLEDYEPTAVYGTSYATPLVTRQAALIDYYTGGALNVATIRALLIHSTNQHERDKKGCGWGRIDRDVQNILFCTDKKVTFIYQGELETATGIRVAVPCPKALLAIKTFVNVEATLCFYAEVDPQHTVSYTKAGVEISFRPHFEKFDYDKKREVYAKEPKTRSLFTKANILGSEQTLRKDNHKWETCYKVYDRMKVSSLSQPIFDIRYLTREEGHPLSAKEMKSLKPLKYSMIVTVELESDFDLYSAVLVDYELLTPISINLDAASLGT